MPNRNLQGDYRYTYQGQEVDPETGKEAFELRLWDARIGRWLTTDPYSQYASPYLGMGNNPISMIDPDGGFACDDCPTGTFADGTEHIGADGGTYIFDAEIGRWSDNAAVIFNITHNKPKATPEHAAAVIAIPLEISGSNGNMNPYLNAAAAGVSIGLGARYLYDSIGDAFTPDYTITSESELPFMVLYRGVSRDHPDYANAILGNAVPWALGPVGHNDPDAHNGANFKSIFTSWTIAPIVANWHANKHGAGGVVLMKRFRINQAIPSPGDALRGEMEFLVPGIVTGASVSWPTGPGNPTAY